MVGINERSKGQKKKLKSMNKLNQLLPKASSEENTDIIGKG